MEDATTPVRSRPAIPARLRAVIAAASISSIGDGAWTAAVPLAAAAVTRDPIAISKIATTMEIYTHVPSEVTRRALKRLGASLDGLGS